ncbi:restriction endonuclease subunit S [Leptospira licerasiae]|uniref:restriction endonuclease subunit S n=1 Tax=Leptospira licerasiae TaxID=447106 RepID=UPI003015FAD0
MNPLLQTHFETVLEHPNGIKKFRELILTLAMQGKLVEQDPNDQSASELSKEIQAEKARLVVEGKIKKIESFDPIKEEEKPFALPKGWEWVRLGDLAEINHGKELPTTMLKSEGFPVFGANGVIGFYETYHYEERQLLISCRGAYSGKPNFSPKFAYVTNNSLVIKFFKNLEILKDFNFYLFSILDRNLIISGSAQPQVTIGNLQKPVLPLPPLAEQKRIVEKIDELFALCDELERLKQAKDAKRKDLHQSVITQMLEAETHSDFQRHFQFLNQHFHELYSVKENVKELRKAVLQLAVMGKLVPQDEKDQPASELLKEIQAEKARLVAEGKIKKSEALPPVKDEETPFAIPKGWEWVRLGDVCEAVDYGTSEKANTSKGIPILRMNNIQDGKLDISNLKFVSEKIKDLPRLFLKNLDLIFNRTNSYELVGKTAVFYGKENSFTLASYLIRATIFKLINIEYLNFYMNSRICRLNEIEPHITQQTNQANFSGSKLKLIKFPLPPLAEQKRIVAKVDELMALCDALEERIGKAEEKRGEILEGMARVS